MLHIVIWSTVVLMDGWYLLITRIFWSCCPAVFNFPITILKAIVSTRAAPVHVQILSAALSLHNCDDLQLADCGVCAEGGGGEHEVTSTADSKSLSGKQEEKSFPEDVQGARWEKTAERTPAALLRPETLHSLSTARRSAVLWRSVECGVLRARTCVSC